MTEIFFISISFLKVGPVRVDKNGMVDGFIRMLAEAFDADFTVVFRAQLIISDSMEVSLRGLLVLGLSICLRILFLFRDLNICC